METNHNMAVEMGGGSGGTPVSSRWNPTKEQIDMLESLYKQGIRTPNADQIQQITSRLKAYGHIEGKNVFYWFQNHKARQRQKQKQESMAYINRFLHMAHHHQPAVFAPPCPDVVCGPYYRAQNELGFYAPQCSKVLIPGGFVKRRPRNEKMDKTRVYAGPGYEPAAMAPHHVPHHECRNQGISMKNESNSSGSGDNNDHETLTLFPLQPTGILQEKSATGSASEAGEGSLPFFNFFSGKGPCENL